ncbi:MAG: hypothetical protein HY645_08740 [Acidobacteria bacterium]|nr:hypothetical protein [Acidobacteriota bacterium]
MRFLYLLLISLLSLPGLATAASVKLLWDASSVPEIAGYNVYRSVRQGGDYLRNSRVA